MEVNHDFNSVKIGCAVQANFYPLLRVGGTMDPPIERQRYVSTLENYNLRLAGRWTTVRMEPPIMEALHAIALAEAVTIHELCTQVAKRRSAGSATSALRLFAAMYFRERCEAASMPSLSSPSGLASQIL